MVPQTEATAVEGVEGVDVELLPHEAAGPTAPLQLLPTIPIHPQNQLSQLSPQQCHPQIHPL